MKLSCTKLIAHGLLYAIVSALFFENIEAFAGLHSGRPADWVNGASFYSDNHGDYANEADIDSRNAAEVVGLELTDKSLGKCVALASRFTNVVALRWTSKRTDPLPSLILAATNFSKLRYLDFLVANAVGMPASMSVLTNLTSLISLDVSGPSLTNIDNSIYGLENLKEIWLELGHADLPDGISKLQHLKSLIIWGKRQIPFGKLPRDIGASAIEDLEVFGVTGIDSRMPVLPANLVELVLSGCQIHQIPQSWSSHHCLQFCTITKCGLTNFPSQLLEIVALKFLNLDFNRITSIPPLNFNGDRSIEISLWANPIQHVAPENDDLVKKNRLEYDGDGQTNRITHDY